MNDMIVKSNKEQLYESHLTRLFNRIQEYNMRLNPKKCTFHVKAHIFLGFYLIQICIKVNLDKRETIIKTETLTTKEGIMKLNGMLIALNIFMFVWKETIFLALSILMETIHYFYLGSKLWQPCVEFVSSYGWNDFSVASSFELRWGWQCEPF